MNFSKLFLPLCFALVFINLSAPGQNLDYSMVFGKDWEKAEEFVASNEDWIRADLKLERIDYLTAVSVIFPELIRYSALRDMMEITLLKALYVNLGDDYANFSIGNFQIKPSFAQEVCESEYPKLLSRQGLRIPDRSDFKSDREYRSAIVSSLEDTRTEFNYIVRFIKICESKFDLEMMDEPCRVVFLSTAYNYGFNRTRQEIENMKDKKYFSTRLIGTEFYSYSDISLYWYNKYSKTR
jgi:hypothetical protein